MRCRGEINRVTAPMPEVGASGVQLVCPPSGFGLTYQVGADIRRETWVQEEIDVKDGEDRACFAPLSEDPHASQKPKRPW